MPPSINKSGGLAAISVKKLSYPAIILALVLNVKLSYSILKAPEPQGRNWVNEIQLWDQLRNLNTNKSIAFSEE